MRELDKWIAENVMGSHVAAINCELNGKKWVYFRETKMFMSFAEDLTQYTVCMRAAFEAAKRFYSDYKNVYAWNIEQDFGCQSPALCWQVYVTFAVNNGELVKERYEECEHPALAICVAIYKLKTGKDWKEDE